MKKKEELWFNKLAKFPPFVPLIILVFTMNWAIVKLFVEMEYVKTELPGLRGEISTLQSNDKINAVNEGVISQQLSDISNRLGRIENKLDR